MRAKKKPAGAGFRSLYFYFIGLVEIVGQARRGVGCFRMRGLQIEVCGGDLTALSDLAIHVVQNPDVAGGLRQRQHKAITGK
jgi:hypothetical protein